MKLTIQQIAKIDETLVLNGLIYNDIKLEVTDHIASEIEAEMEESSISFDQIAVIAGNNQWFAENKESLKVGFLVILQN